MHIDQVKKATEKWGENKNRFVVFCGDHTEPEAYITAFDDAMDAIVDHSREHAAIDRYGIALAFSSTERKEDCSYRRVLKKYTSSPVFEDLNIYLLLILNDEGLWEIAPSVAPIFLKGLNRYVAGS